jgi:hypothetical protein
VVSNSNVIINDAIGASGKGARSDCARAVGGIFCKIIALLDEEREAVSVRGLEELLGEEHHHQILQAVTAARFWNLIRVTGKGGPWLKDRLYSESVVQLTEAGRYWHQALARDAGRKSVPKDRNKSQSIRINKLVASGGVKFAGRDISDTHITTAELQPSNDQLLAWLKLMRDSQDISWSGLELAEVRRIIERALAEQNPQIPGLKRALKKLQSVCGDVLVGILGNGAYQLLQNFITHVL